MTLAYQGAKEISGDSNRVPKRRNARSRRLVFILFRKFQFIINQLTTSKFRLDHPKM